MAVRDAWRDIAIATFLGAVCLALLIVHPLMGIGPAWPVNGLIAISFIIVVVFAWRVWEAVRRRP
jgi:type VI protein secretion system component VasK